LKQGRSQKEIEESIGVHTSTISRDIHRNKDRTTEEYPNPNPSSTLCLTIIENLYLEYRHYANKGVKPLVWVKEFYEQKLWLMF